MVGASFSHHAPGGGIWPDGTGMPDPRPQSPPTNPADLCRLGRVEDGLQQLDGQQHLGQPQGPGPGPLHRLRSRGGSQEVGLAPHAGGAPTYLTLVVVVE